MANKAVVLIKKIFEKKENPCYLGLPPKPGVRTFHENRPVNWLTKKTGIRKLFDHGKQGPLTEGALSTLLGG